MVAALSSGQSGRNDCEASLLERGYMSKYHSTPRQRQVFVRFGVLPGDTGAVWEARNMTTTKWPNVQEVFRSYVCLEPRRSPHVDSEDSTMEAMVRWLPWC